MHKSGIFTERELLFWENTPALQGWTETQDFFDTIWTDRAAFKIRLEGARPYKSAMAMSTTRTSKQDHKEAMYLLHSLERENATLKDELDASVATTATPPSTTLPPKIIAATTTTGRDNALISALKEQSATQTAQITKFLAALSNGGGSDGRGNSGRGRRDGGRGRGDGNKNPKHKYYKNCKRVVAHETA